MACSRITRPAAAKRGHSTRNRPLTVLAGWPINHGANVHEGSHAAADEGIRADTTFKVVEESHRAMPRRRVTAGNAEPVSPMARSACVVMNPTLAEKEGLKR